MNRSIILTKQEDEGRKLKRMLISQDSSFENIICYRKEDLGEAQTKEVESIFSTWYMPTFNAEEINCIFPNLKSIYYAAGTVKYFAKPFLQQGVKVYSAGKANGIPVAEYVAASIILANKGVFQAQRAYRWPIWTKGFGRIRNRTTLKSGNYSAKVGIIGCGTIGSKVVELLKPYKLDLMVYDPYISQERIEKLGVHKVDLKELFQSSDVITNHLPDNEDTKGIINYELLSIMKPTATFINTGRGRQVVESDLARTMRNCPSRCAILDVTTHEPLFPWSPLYFCNNVFLTPHIAGSLGNEFGRMVEYVLKAYHDNSWAVSCEVTMENFAHQA